MSLIKGKQIAVNTVTGGASGNLALNTIDYSNVDETVLSTQGNAYFDASIGGNETWIKNVLDPVDPQDAATKAYVDQYLTGISWKNPVAAATTAALTDPYTATALTLTQNAPFSALPTSDFDNQPLSPGMRVLVKNEAGALEPNNGIYVITDVGSGLTPWILTRASDANLASELNGAAVAVSELSGGGTQDDTVWLQTSPITTLGTDNVSFVRFGQAYTAGNGIDAVQLASGTIAVDITAAPNASAEGLTFNGTKVAVALEAPSSGQGGLRFSAQGEVKIRLATDTPGVGSAAEGGLKLTNNGLSAELATPSAGTGSGATGGLQIAATGLSVRLQAPNQGDGGLRLVGANGEIAIQVAPTTYPTNENGTGAEGGLKLTTNGLSMSIAANKALFLNAANELEVHTQLTAPGLGISTGSGGGLYVIAGDGILVTGSGVEVDFAGTPAANVGKTGSSGSATTVSRSDHVHASPSPVIADHNIAGSPTATPLTACATSNISQTPAFSTPASSGSYVSVKVNGVQYPLGNGSDGTGAPGTVAFYFAPPGQPNNPRAINAIQANDQLYYGNWTGVAVPAAGDGIFGQTGVEATDSFDYDYIAIY